MQSQSTKPRPRLQRTCQQCGKAFTAHQCEIDKGGGKYCSPACYRAKYASAVRRRCLVCGVEFLAVAHNVKRGGGKYCGFACKVVGVRNKPLELRFWTKVRKGDDCWLWVGQKAGNGYGVLLYKGRRLMAHRLAWEILRGPIPDGLWVLHNCPGGDNPQCVNPNHLFLGTHADNMADMVQKGRSTRGRRDAAAKATPAIVRAVREAYQTGQFTLRFLASKHGLSQSAVWKIVRRKTWGHVS